MPCNKPKCLKQLNKNIPNIYFGTPFEYDENVLACHFCRPEGTKERIVESPTGKFTRRIVQ